MILEIIKPFLPAVLIFGGLAICLLAIYAQRMRNRYDELSDQYCIDERSPLFREGMVVDLETGDIISQKSGQLTDSGMKSIM